MRRPLTALERRILDYLVDYLKRNTYQPSIREIGENFGIRSTRTVSEHLQAIADKGWIERDAARPRALRLVGVELGNGTVRVPRYAPNSRNGFDPSAAPVLEAFELDRKIAGPAGTFILAMTGDTLADQGIQDGDLLLIQPASAEDMSEGEVVVLAAGEGARVARYRRRALAASGRAGAVRGRVIGVIRRLHVPPPKHPAAGDGGRS